MRFAIDRSYIHHQRGRRYCLTGLSNHSRRYREELRKRDRAFNKPLLVFEQQDSGRNPKCADRARNFPGWIESTSEAPARATSKLCVGLKCGGHGLRYLRQSAIWPHC